MDIAALINHPEQLDRDSLYELRSMLALYPYFQNARLLLLQNLFLLHDPSFDEELRRAAIYITDRRVLFQMIEASHYRLKSIQQEPEHVTRSKDEQDSRTLSLIDLPMPPWTMWPTSWKTRPRKTANWQPRRHNSSDRNSSTHSSRTTKAKLSSAKIPPSNQTLTHKRKQNKKRKKMRFTPKLWPEFTSNRAIICVLCK